MNEYDAIRAAFAHNRKDAELLLQYDLIPVVRALHDEVMNASVTYLRRNTARVLMQVMKELVRERDPQRQRP